MPIRTTASAATVLWDKERNRQRKIERATEKKKVRETKIQTERNR